MTNGHKQVGVKVNTDVDAGVADLVGVLNSFPALRTIESCEDIGGGAAWVCFHYVDKTGAHPWSGLANFILGHFGPGLMEKIGDRAEISIYVTTTGLPQAELTVKPGAMPAAVKAIRSLRRKFNAVADRTYGCSCDR